MRGVNSLLMSPAPRATNEPRPAALIDVKKLETPRSASRLPAASPKPPPPFAPPAALFPSQASFPLPLTQTGLGLRPPPYSLVSLHHSSLKRRGRHALEGLGDLEGETYQSLRITVKRQRDWGWVTSAALLSPRDSYLALCLLERDLVTLRVSEVQALTTQTHP